MPKPGQRLINQPAFVGITPNVEDSDQLLGDLQQRTIEILQEATESGGVTKAHDREFFFDVFLEAVRRLEDIEERSHPLKLDENLMWLNEPSPNVELAKSVVTKTLKTSFAAINGHCENNSGFAIPGPEGVGKTTLLRLIAVVCPQLLPNFQSVFLGLDQLECYPGIIVDALCYATEAAGLPLSQENEIRRRPNVFDAFWNNRAAIGLFVDDLPQLYSPEFAEDWKSIEHLASTTESTMGVVSGSSTYLRDMVQANADGLGDKFVPELKSLNESRLKIKMAKKLTDSARTQYGAYWRKQLSAARSKWRNRPRSNPAVNPYVCC